MSLRKNIFIEIYSDALIFPFLGFGINGYRHRNLRGFGIWYHKQEGQVYISFWRTWIFSIMHLNRKIYLEKQYPRRKREKNGNS